MPTRNKKNPNHTCNMDLATDIWNTPWAWLAVSQLIIWETIGNTPVTVIRRTGSTVYRIKVCQSIHLLCTVEMQTIMADTWEKNPLEKISCSDSGPSPPVRPFRCLTKSSYFLRLYWAFWRKSFQLLFQACQSTAFFSLRDTWVKCQLPQKVNLLLSLTIS